MHRIDKASTTITKQKIDAIKAKDLERERKYVEEFHDFIVQDAEQVKGISSARSHKDSTRKPRQREEKF